LTAAPEEFRRDPELFAQATTRPGAKIPHAWVVGEDGRRLSTLDIVGAGKFTLLTGLAGTAWVAAAASVNHEFLRTVVIGSPVAQDLYLEWAAAREVDEAGALLVRPDGYIAWRCGRPVTDDCEATRLLETALGLLLHPDAG
jgi:2,4-dichlorophenol 6-monooxygenase